MLKHFITGLFIKFITGIDDSMVHVPIITRITKTKKGKFAFSLGILLAISAAILISFLLSSIILKQFKYYHIIAAILIFALAASIHFDLFLNAPKQAVEKKMKKIKRISFKRFMKLLGIGFITAFVTVIDDSIAYMSLFIGDIKTVPFSILGIYTAAFLEIFLIIKFSKKYSKIPNRKLISVFGLVILGFLTLFKII